MAEATLVLAGRSELVVRMALIAYQAELTKLKKREEESGVATDGTEELLSAAKDILSQLGWKPKEKGTAEVLRDEGPSLFDPTADPDKDTGTGDLLGGPPATPAEPKVFEVSCLQCTAKFQARGTKAECPDCGEAFTILADEEGKVVRLVRQKKRGKKPGGEA